MRVGILQFGPQLGSFDDNIKRAESILATADCQSLDLLVLPELAFSGYNFPDLPSIKPFLEPTAAGPTTRWAINTARRLNCHIIVGYPEIHTDLSGGETTNYNSTVTVSPTGEVLNNYRKSFLYYTDEIWATEGFLSSQARTPFSITSISGIGPVGHGICMDINPYRFEAPWTDYEFANSMLRAGVKTIVLSMAWLTRLAPADLEIEPEKPDMETVAYWLERFFPLRDAESNPMVEDDVIVVFANRCGIEGNRIGSVRVENGGEVEDGDRVCYAGSSCVMRFQGGGVRMFEKKDREVAILGKGEEALLVVDTGRPARYLLQPRET